MIEKDKKIKEAQEAALRMQELREKDIAQRLADEKQRLERERDDKSTRFNDILDNSVATCTRVPGNKFREKVCQKSIKGCHHPQSFIHSHQLLI